MSVISTRFPPELLERVDQFAKETYRSRSEAIQFFAARGLAEAETEAGRG